MKKDQEDGVRQPGWIVAGIVAGELLKDVAVAAKSIISKPAPTEIPGVNAVRANASKREQDETGKSVDETEESGTVLVAICFVSSIIFGLSFLIFFWMGGPNWKLGGSLAISLGSLGAGLVFTAHRLMQYREAVEEREELSSPEEEREATANDYEFSVYEIRRRGLLKWMIAGVTVVFASIGISMFRSFGMDPAKKLYDRVWSRGQRLMTKDRKPVSVDTLVPGSFVIVYPEDQIGSEKAQTVLIRVEDGALQLPPERTDWAPSGYVAYSRVCTHAGCPVGMYETTTHLLLCPCHQSTFDIRNCAKPTSGPAARPLPQVPLYADGDGTLRAGGPFTEPPGPGFWEMP